MKLCDYGCGQEALFQFKNGKWCCSESHNSCPVSKERVKQQMNRKNNPNLGKKYSFERKQKISKTLKGKMVGKKNPFYKKTHTEKTKKQMRLKKLGKKLSKETIEKMIKSRKLTIEKITEKYSLFSKIEKMRYNPDKPKEKEIQVHCKNHKCENSKEKGGWFTPGKWQLTDRRRALEKDDGNDGHYFYCSQKCKDTCELYNIYGDPYKDNNLPYTPAEYQTFRTFVLERDNYICQFCGKPATNVHHERPQKLEPFFSLDPDYAWSCCEKCHYEKGHQGECSTGNLAKIVCRNRGDKFI